ncbi:MAG: glycoside hydrolase family 3 C-terminal domain-containing protein, partial [Clostridia bacterium]|nr:glycoside hydrolase family 3 C-terminal domain-containing protein [Clostridia bacterium]
ATKSKSHVVFSSIFLALFVVLLVITIVITQNKFLYYTICSVIGGSERYLKEGDPAEHQYYVSEYENKSEVLSAAYDLNEEICEEGFVLLKNENGALPLSKNSKVTVFGKNSVDIVLGGSGSNAGSSSGATTLYEGLEQANIQYNPTLKSYYESKQSGSGRPDPLPMGSILTGWPIAEAALPYPQDVQNSYSEYSDAALVVLSRVGGEGFDLPRTMFWNDSGSSAVKKYTDWKEGSDLIPGARSTSDHYLQLDQNETDMLKEACENFDKVIVLINSSSTLELGFLDDPTHYAYHENIVGALWIGAPGYTGLAALGKILTGEVTPSGSTADTYARNCKNDPTWYNFGNNMERYGNAYMVGDTKFAAYYVEYLEGIYSGYRYWETRAFSSDQAWYKNNVVYPFGYGLSYTDFTLSAVNENATALSKDGKLTFNVNVQNVGVNYDGKETVQLYYSAPYNSDEIEKPHVVLGDFAKTQVLTKNGGTGNVTLELNVRDMASYDYNDANNNGFKGYELDEGEYTVYITNGKQGAHCWADQNVIKFKFTVPQGGFQYSTDEVTGTDINNLFDDVSNHVDEYLSRKNNFQNFNVLAKGYTEHRTVTQQFRDEFDASCRVTAVSDSVSDPWYSENMPEQSKRVLSSQETKIKLYDLIGKSYNDALWDELLNQLTVAQMVELISTGNFRTLQIENIDKPLTTDADGPMGYTIFMDGTEKPAVYDTCYYASEVILASTYNEELAYKMGKMVGNEGVIGNERGDGAPYSGWYAPAMNIHRNQFGGRNFEYYSEDGYLSSVMASNVVKGAREMGVYTYAKHFALNDQETNRDDTGLITWANEQAMREIYFAPFESCVKDGKTTAMMSSFNRIGTTWAGGNYELLTKLLREEWGFNGMVITDYNLKDYMNADNMIRAGGDLNLSGGKSPSSITSATDVTALRKATKNILYTVANSCAMNGYADGVVWGYTTPWWVYVLVGVDVAIFATAATLWTLWFIKKKKSI